MLKFYKRTDGQIVINEAIGEEPVQSLMKRLICFTGLWMLIGGLWYFAAIRSDRVSRPRSACGGACRLSAAERVYLGLCAAVYLSFAILFRNMYRYGPDESYRFLVAQFIYKNGILPNGGEEII